MTDVIVITGPGRSGTSFLASLYRELGFDPGGAWRESVNAGLEDKKFTDLNEAVSAALGVVPAPGKGPNHLRWMDRLVKRLPLKVRTPFNEVIDQLRYRRPGIDVLDRGKLDAVAQTFGPELKALAEQTSVIKDPRFSWTLQVWLMSGAPIETVVLCLRPIDSMVTSRIRGGWIRERARSWATGNFAYGIGLTVAATSEFRTPVVQLLFPGFLREPEDLYARLPLPEPRTWEEFHRAYSAVVDESLVHE